MLEVRNTFESFAGDSGSKASAFNLIADLPNGDLAVVNTLADSRIVIPGGQAEYFRRLLDGSAEVSPGLDEATRDTLTRLGMLVPTGSNEQRKLRHLQAHDTSNDRALHLIVLPTEKCNFRCDYCYETFTVGKMKPAIRGGLVKHIATRVPKLEALSVDWFGGEPLLAIDVIADILPEVNRLCEEHRCRLSGHITTNGSLLTPEVATRLLDWKVNSFQITLDGPEAEHDKRRKLHVPRGQKDSRPTGTFQQVMFNLDALLSQRRMFELQIRTNYDLDSLPAMDGWIEELSRKYAKDPRVRVDFCPIWADPCKVDVSIPMGPEKQRTYIDLMGKAQAAGLRTNASDYLSLGKLVCYAAKANSLVVRANGDLAKCTVALESDVNRVGSLAPDGALHIDLDKFVAWTSTGLEEDSVCQACALSPSCQGNACPLERLENQNRPCPPPKAFPAEALRLTVPIT